MPFPLTLTPTDGSPAQWLTVPTRWADVTLAQFVTLHGTPGTVPIEVLTGLTGEQINQLSVLAVQQLANLLAFAADPADVLALLPTPGLPDIGTLPYGTLLLATTHLEARSGLPWLAYAPYLLALYRVQLAFGKYDANRVAACEAALLAAPVTEVYGDASFFLSSYKAWSSGIGPTSSTPTSPTTTSTRQASKPLRRASACFSAWMRRRAAPC